MRGMVRLTGTAALLLMALVPIVASVPPEPSSSTKIESRLPVAIAQPLASADRVSIVALPKGIAPAVSESGMLVLVGSALIGLAAIVRRTT